MGSDDAKPSAWHRSAHVLPSYCIAHVRARPYDGRNVETHIGRMSSGEKGRDRDVEENGQAQLRKGTWRRDRVG